MGRRLLDCWGAGSVEGTWSVFFGLFVRDISLGGWWFGLGGMVWDSYHAVTGLSLRVMLLFMFDCHGRLWTVDDSLIEAELEDYSLLALHLIDRVTCDV